MPTLSTQKVVIDTTTIRSGKGRLLAGPVADLLGVGIKRLHLKFYVPKVVVEEAVWQYKRECRDRLEKICVAIESLKHFLVSGREISVSAFELQEAVNEYRERLTQRIQELGGLLVEYDNVPHSNVLNRVYDRMKPFDEKGKGYQDSLMWESILSHVVTADEVTAFITANSNDFCDKDSGALHSTLARELLAKGFQEDSVRIFKSIEEFNEIHIKPSLEKLQEGKSTGSADWSFAGFSLLSFYEHHFDQIVDYVRSLQEEIDDDVSKIFGSSFSVSGVYLSTLGEPEDILAEDVRRVDDHTAAIGVGFRALGSVHFDIYKTDFEHVYRDPDVVVVDKNLNEHMMTIGCQLTFEFHIEITCNAETGDVQDWMITYFDVIS